MFSLNSKMKFDALFGGFIWSHVLLQELDVLLTKLTSFLKPNATIAFIDSKPLAGGVHDSKNIFKTDEKGNTYQLRKLENQTTHLVLKNFPSQELLIQKLSKFSDDISYTELEHYWIAICKMDKT